MKLTDFFNNEYVDQASYDNLRKIASVIDGQKNTSRKILYTILEKNIKSEIKVLQLSNKMAEFAEYLHGDASGVVVTMAQNYPGTNNLPLLTREGNFGTRFANEASASRYIYTYGSDELFNLFNKDDNAVLEKQYFEGEQIEPVFYVPSIPLLIVNGSEGVSSGFAQKILPRDPEKIKQYIKNKIQGKTSRYKFEPYYNGFNGIIEQGDNSAQWLIKGTIQRKSVNKIIINELPIGYDLKGYCKILDDLEDKKIIQSYRDKSENDKFNFEVTIPSRDLKTWSDETLLNKLKLIKKITENYTVMSEQNKIKVMNSAKEICDYFIDIKLKYLQKRKDHKLSILSEEIKYDNSKYLFIKLIQDDKLIINKRKKKVIENDLDKIQDIYKKTNTYDYLLNMSIQSLTEERMKQLQNSIKTKQSELDKLEKLSIISIWNSEL